VTGMIVSLARIPRSIRQQLVGLRAVWSSFACIPTLTTFLAAIMLTAAGAGQAAAQTITVDPATAVEAASSSVTMNHSVGNGSDRYLVVSVAIERRDATVNSVTYGGQALSFLGRITDANTAATLDVWGRAAPVSGTNQIVVTLSGSAAVVVGAISFGGVDQTSPIAASQFASGTSGLTASASVASATDQLVLAVIAANDSVNSVTTGAGQTSRWNVVNAADVIGAASTRTGAATTTTMSYSFGAQGGWGMGLIALRPADPRIVKNTNDSGSGSLRNAIQFVNTQGAAATISFAIPGAGPHTITLSSPLPDITANGLTIDGTTQSGSQCRDLWAGSGHDLRIEIRGNSGFDGFRLAGANQTIRGLSLTGFGNAIFTLSSSSNATIRCNYLGLVPGGTASGNTRGVWAGGSGARIGGLTAGEGNVISSNSIVGVLTVNGSTDTAVQGNFIGTDPTGMSARANGGGINNFNGTVTWRDITYNLIAGNSGAAGIALETDDRISPSTDTIRIQRNRIGFNRTLSALLPNGGDGIFFDSASIANVLIGGNAATDGNEITGGNDAIDLRAVNNIRIRGNTIARANGRGIWLAGSSDITIGGTGSGEGNSIGGNGADGVFAGFDANGITIVGNRLQPVTIAGATTSNADHGIWVQRVNSVTIGDGSAAGRNIISGNGRRAIQGSSTNANVTINGNYIGTDATGNVAVSNGQNADASTRDAIAFDASGTNDNLRITNNVIGGYSAALVELWNSTSNGVVITGNRIGVGANGVSQIVSGNIEDLVSIGGGTSHSNVIIGGETTELGNTIAFSARSGIRVESTGNNLQVIGNTIRNNALTGVYVVGSTRAALVSNRIYANGQIGIDLNENGVTLNDPGDSDSGPNNLLNFPAITSVNVSGNNQLIYGFTFDGPAETNGYRIEFFANSAADASGYGEGETYLGHVDIAHSGGSQTYSGNMTALAPIGIGSIISATATRKTAGGTWDITSEFSATATAQGIAQLTAALTSTPFDQGSGAAFSTPGSDVSLTATVTNTGSGSTQSNSIFTVISINNTSSFFNAETPAFGGIVRFSSTSPLLTFTPATDLRFSNAATAPTEFAQCTYTPAAGYDPLVRFVCLNPKGSLPHSAPQNQFSVELRARIN